MNGIFCIPLPGRLRAPDGGLNQAGQQTVALRGFFAGPENRLAEFGVQAALVAQPRRFHPLVIFGPSGAGKSHLALGVATQWRQRQPSASVICRNALDFSWEVAAAIENQSLSEMRSRYEAASLVVIEDLEHIELKEAAQRELALISDILDRRGGQAVVTSRRRPTAIPHLLPRLRSRLAAGLVVPVSPPGLAARLEILKQLAALNCIPLTLDAAQLLAERLIHSVWQLHSALQRLHRTATPGAALTRADAAHFLSRQASDSAPAIADIATATAKHFGLHVRALRSSSRRRMLVRARGVAMFLARTITGTSLKAVGKYFGGRDHTTVLHACRRTAKQLVAEPQLQHAVDTIRKTLAASHNHIWKTCPLPVDRPHAG